MDCPLAERSFGHPPRSAEGVDLIENLRVRAHGLTFSRICPTRQEDIADPLPRAIKIGLIRADGTGLAETTEGLD